MTFHSNSTAGLSKFLQGAEYICGHNIFNHDLKYLQNTIIAAGINPSNIIDTLYLSPLLFPTRPYHALLKDLPPQPSQRWLKTSGSISERSYSLTWSSIVPMPPESSVKKKYSPIKAKIRFIVFWQKENTACEIKIILPELYFARQEE